MLDKFAAKQVEEPLNEFQRNELLESYIQIGLVLMMRGEYEEATTHFENQEVASVIGLSIELWTASVMESLNDNEEIEELSYQLNRQSSFNYITHLLKLATLTTPQSLRKTLEGKRTIWPTDQIPTHTIELPQTLHQETALVHAEQWLYARDVLISGHNPVMDEDNTDFNVAQYFYKLGIPMTKNFISMHTEPRTYLRPGDVIGGERRDLS